MGIDLMAYMFVGVDARDAIDARGKSLLQRFRAGEFSRAGDKARGIRTLDDLPRGRFPGVLRVDSPGDWYNRSRARYYLGAGVGWVYNRGGPDDNQAVAGRPRLDRTFRMVRRDLLRIGILTEPKLYLLTTVS